MHDPSRGCHRYFISLVSHRCVEIRDFMGDFLEGATRRDCQREIRMAVLEFENGFAIIAETFRVESSKSVDSSYSVHCPFVIQVIIIRIRHGIASDINRIVGKYIFLQGKQFLMRFNTYTRYLLGEPLFATSRSRCRN